MPTWGEILTELADTAKRHNGPPRFDEVRRKYLAQLSQHTGRNTILYATKWVQGGVGPDLISITPEDIHGFMEAIHGLPANGLDIILHSPGGSAEDTEALVKYIRSKFTDVRVIIPHAAMSAATMLACSANRIVMAKHSFLGPIDPQFIIASETGVRAVPAHAILEQFALAQKECRDPALLPVWLPILRQYGPALLVQCQLAQQLSETLVRQWLERYMFAGDRQAKAKAKRAAQHLANHANFLSHSRVISCDDAKKLGLRVENLESDPRLQDLVLSVFHAANHTFQATPCVKVIENHHGKAFIRSRIYPK